MAGRLPVPVVGRGAMNRPALHQLLADITAGRADTVVVYKIELRKGQKDIEGQASHRGRRVA
jgi:DNA invertase Pin-like site-specific DNA recombinase